MATTLTKYTLSVSISPQFFFWNRPTFTVLRCVHCSVSTHSSLSVQPLCPPPLLLNVTCVVSMTHSRLKSFRTFETHSQLKRFAVVHNFLPVLYRRRVMVRTSVEDAGGHGGCLGARL